MLVAWMSAGSLGMMVARFNKKLGKGRTMCGKELWFVGAHPVLGCLLMILSLLQPLGAVLRCGPQHPRLIDSSQNQWLLKVMGGFVGWEALYFLLSDLDLRWNQNNDGLFLLGNLAFLVALLVGIGMS
uniref:Uncharacterized protein n=1 Tax=Knipowitschia caucasica TaxID=637954 RepID=A0AAV2JIZ9_KNICA